MENQVPIIWIILGAYVLPTILSAVGLWKQYHKDKDQIEKDRDKDTGDISIRWAAEFRERLKCVEEELATTRAVLEDRKEENHKLKEEIDKLKILNADQNARIIKLEKERKELLKEITVLRERIKELESENKRLKES